MLHPHIPEDLKHFGKHLFATFLGLLMALGLEQWREHHHEVKLAEQALAAVEAELAQNGKDLEERLNLIQSEEKPLDEYVQAFSKAVRSRGKGDRAELPKRPSLKTPDLFFTCSAWETAKALGLPRHLPPGRIQRISEVYTSMQRAIGVMDGMVAAPAVSDLFVYAKAEPATLSQAEMERMSYALRFQQSRQSQMLRLGREILKEIQEARRP